MKKEYDSSKSKKNKHAEKLKKDKAPKKVKVPKEPKPKGWVFSDPGKVATPQAPEFPAETPEEATAAPEGDVQKADAGVSMVSSKGLSRRLRCSKCHGIIQSQSVHDFAWCPCKTIAVDGGMDYIRMVGSQEDIEVEWDGKFITLREYSQKKW